MSIVQPYNDGLFLKFGSKMQEIVLHTANPVGRANMQRNIDRYWPHVGDEA